MDTDTVISTVESSAIYAVLVVVVVEVIRRRVTIDGWRVLVVAGCVSLAVAAICLKTTDLPSLVIGLRYAFVAWLLAVGGDAWVSKIATKASAIPVVDPAAWRSELPTRKEGSSNAPTAI